MTEILSKSIEGLFRAKTAEEYSEILTNYAIGVCMDSDIRKECFTVNREKNIPKNKIIKILEWVASGFTGSSSLFMAAVGGGVSPMECHCVGDIYDFNRCLNLVHHVPELREDFKIIRNFSETWDKIISNWDKLEAVFIDECGLNFSKSRKAVKSSQLLSEVLNGEA